MSNFTNGATKETLMTFKNMVSETLKSIDMCIKTTVCGPYKNERISLLLSSKTDMQLVENIIDTRIENYDKETEVERITAIMEILKIQRETINRMEIVSKLCSMNT